eukprot:1230131-Alexandrium_andersonii.AAC.1
MRSGCGDISARQTRVLYAQGLWQYIGVAELGVSCAGGVAIVEQGKVGCFMHRVECLMYRGSGSEHSAARKSAYRGVSTARRADFQVARSPVVAAPTELNRAQTLPARTCLHTTQPSQGAGGARVAFSSGP